jgi:hypothetical protein
MKVVALLESMWGWRGYNTPGEEAPRFFRINPENFSGRRLYKLVGDANLIVTNSCRTVQASANHHGKPDPEWVAENLRTAYLDGADLFLICGKVAQETFKTAMAKVGFTIPRVILMDHPAARRWTAEGMDRIKAQIDALRTECA